MISTSRILRKSAMPNMPKMPSFSPKKIGDFLGDMIAGHNLFIADIPKQFDQAHAKHFAFVEGLASVPALTLTIVHYFSMFCQYSTRVQLLPPLQDELLSKARSMNFWLDQFARREALQSVPWRVGILTAQVATFPVWLLLSSASPAVVHATMERVNHIMSSKYQCIDKRAPPFVATHQHATARAEEFHRLQTHLPTDIGAAVMLLLIFLYLMT